MKIVSCRDVSMSFGKKQVLDQISFDIEAGSPVALVGPNGAGKTTLLSLLCGYIRQQAGEIRIFDSSPSKSALLGRVSALPQDVRLDPKLTIQRQLILFARLQGFDKQASKAECSRVLSLVGLSDVAGQKSSQLSHGMNKRISIAQALIGTPELILLDEPTAGLDPVSAKMVREHIKEQSAQSTFIISSHNLDELERLCDQVLYLDKGVLNQSISIKNNVTNDCLTLKMQRCDGEQLTNQLLQLAEINKVINKQPDEFIIHHSNDKGYELETKIMQLMANNQWVYHSLQRGRTLEDKLLHRQEE